MEHLILNALPILKQTILQGCNNLYYIIGENLASLHDTWLRIPISRVDWNGKFAISLETEMMVYWVAIDSMSAQVIIPFDFWLEQY